MNTQAILNQQAIDMLPQVKLLIEDAESFEANQMRNRALKEIMNSNTTLTDMSSKELDSFQESIIDIFKHFDWIK